MKIYRVITENMSFDELGALATRHPDAIMLTFNSKMVIADREFADVAACGCARCDEAARMAKRECDGDWVSYISRFMILCPECGNKRCPRATSHELACTGSNEPGQEGSNYA